MDDTARQIKNYKLLFHATVLVNTNGATDDIYKEKSVEFVLDEVAIKVIQDSPPWTPAFQNGKTMKAYRRQPLTFVVKEE